MKRIKLDVQLRQETGSGPASRLRKDGRIPAVVYGTSGTHGLSINEVAFRTLMREVGDSAAIIELHEEGKDAIISVIQEVQRNALTGGYNHVDFHEVNRGVLMTAHVPVHLAGTAAGVKLDGGVIDHPIHSVDVRCLPKDLPEYIEVDITDLRAGQALHLRDLTAPEGVQLLGEEDMVIVACTGSTPEEAPAEPEAAVAEGEAEEAPAAAE